MIVSTFDDYNRRYFELVIRGSRLVHADNAVEIYSIENRRAAAFWFSETKWCVKENPWFEDYLEHGPLLLIRSLKRGRDYLLAPADGEFRNSRNRGVSLPHFVQEHPSAFQVLRGFGIFWHRFDLDMPPKSQIIYAPPKGKRHNLTISSSQAWLCVSTTPRRPA